jgi:hypothetical protein
MKDVWSFSLSDIKTNEILPEDVIKAAEICINILRIKLKSIEDSINPSKEISTVKEIADFIKETAKKKWPEIFYIDGELLGEEVTVLLHYYPPSHNAPLSLGLMIYSHSRAWLKASKEKKKKFNEMFAELKRALSVKDENVDHDTEYEEMYGKLGREGFII